MRALLTRDEFTAIDTLGILEVIDDVGQRVFSCYTMEDEARPVGVKITSKTCIHEGRYLIDVNYSNRFQRMMPVIYNVSEDYSVQDAKGARWTGIRIHAGNTEKDTDGCILVGANRSPHTVLDSRITFSKLFPLIMLTKRPMPFEIINRQREY